MGETRIAKTTLGRKLAEYTSKVKLGEDKDFIAKLKASDAKSFGYPTLEEFQKDLDALEANKSRTGKREIDHAYQMEFCVKTGKLWSAIRNTTDEVVKTALSELVTFADSYKSTVGIQSAKRTDYRRMVIATVGNGSIQNYFGGWGDGSDNLRNQFGCGRLNADASSNLDGDKITETMVKVLKTSSPYNNGQAVPTAKSSGYEIIPPTDETTDNPTTTEVTVSGDAPTTTSKDGEVVKCPKCHRNHQYGSNKWKSHNP